MKPSKKKSKMIRGNDSRRIIKVINQSNLDQENEIIHYIPSEQMEEEFIEYEEEEEEKAIYKGNHSLLKSAFLLKSDVS